MKFIELHCTNSDDSYFLNFDKVTSIRRWVEGETDVETPETAFYCKETPEEILQKIADAEQRERRLTVRKDGGNEGNIV